MSPPQQAGGFSVSCVGFREVWVVLRILRQRGANLLCLPILSDLIWEGLPVAVRVCWHECYSYALLAQPILPVKDSSSRY